MDITSTYYAVTLHQDAASTTVNAPFVKSLNGARNSQNSVVILSVTLGVQPTGLYVSDGVNWNFVMPMTAVSSAAMVGNTLDVYINKTLDVTLPAISVAYINGQLHGSQTITHGNSIYAVSTPRLSGTTTILQTGAAYTILPTDHTVRGDATAQNQIFTLPTAASAFSAGVGKVYNIKKIDVSVNTVTVKGNGAELIDGANTKVLSTQYASTHVQSNGVTWDVI